jgi:hypothetical protein
MGRMTAISTRPRRIALTALVSAVIGAVILLASSPPEASARDLCAKGEFCLLYNGNLANGLYRFSGSDSNLNNDRFVHNHTNMIVGFNTTAAWNRGRPAALDDVIIYDRPGWRTPFGCIKRDHDGQLPLEAFHRVSSYRWVSDSACRAAGVLRLPGSIISRPD